MNIKRVETYNGHGELIHSEENPWTQNDYLIAIKRLEAQITPRRIREAVLGADGGWLAQQEAAIDALRGQL